MEITNRGAYSRIFKHCSICGKLKYYTKFVSNGRDKWRRKSYCHLCKHLEKIRDKISFDITKLQRSSIYVRLRGYSSPYKYYLTTYQDAVVLVQDKVAGVVNKRLIHLIYDKDTFKSEILLRDRYVCRYCGNRGNTIDHVKPVSKGGLTTFSNCVCACESCNNEKGNLSLKEFLISRNQSINE
ncbi:HNH endonuclease [Terribacillus saccharophilus]|uniref:HNH endonuclease n=1 Tax=Terribacillus saccharophilus TaxID=361277 RepID=UPI0014831806